MKNNRADSILSVIAILFSASLILLFTAGYGLCSGSIPNLSGPSGLIYLPTAYSGGGFGYYSLSGNKITKLNMAFYNGALEGGVIYNKLASNYSFNLKLSLIEEDDYLPQIALGLYNYRNSAISTTNYIVLSKQIEPLGVTLHAGYKKNGGLKDAAGLFNYRTFQSALDDYENGTGNTFLGLEYAFLPMFSIMGEQYEKSLNAGIRFRPAPMLSIDYDFIDIKKQKNFKENRVLNFNFSLGF